ncbi:unnamed protein product [Camellia sinensis]
MFFDDLPVRKQGLCEEKYVGMLQIVSNTIEKCLQLFKEACLCGFFQKEGLICSDVVPQHSGMQTEGLICSDVVPQHSGMQMDDLISPTQGPSEIATEQPTTQEHENESTKNQSNNVKGKRERSLVWDRFTKLKCESGKRPRASCNYCGTTYACDPKIYGTTSMRAHIESKCKKYPLRQDEKQSTVGFKPKNETGDGETVGNLVAVSFSVDACRKALAKMIIIGELPFKFVEGEGFRQFMHVVQPMWLKIPSKITIAKECMSIFESEKKALKNALRGQ